MVCCICGPLLDRRCDSIDKVEESRYGRFRIIAGLSYLLCIHNRNVDIARATAYAHAGRDQTLVLVLPLAHGHRHLCEMEIQMDPQLQHDDGSDVHMHQPLQAGDPQQDPHAGTAEPLVRAARHRLYVRLCAHGSRDHIRTLPMVEIIQESRQRRRNGCLRHSCTYRMGIPDTRHDHGSTLGKGSMGRFLDMGP